MTENKRFTECDDGTYCLMDNGNGLEYDDVVDLLNDLNDENEYIKHLIKEAYNNERTHIGKNTLKQLMEAIQ